MLRREERGADHSCSARGTRNSAEFTVADQQSTPSAGTFSYALPAVVSVSPVSAPTYSNPTAPTTITVRARNLPLLDLLCFYKVQLGQGASAVMKAISSSSCASV